MRLETPDANFDVGQHTPSCRIRQATFLSNFAAAENGWSPAEGQQRPLEAHKTGGGWQWINFFPLGVGKFVGQIGLRSCRQYRSR